MKRIISILLAVLTALTLVACQKTPESPIVVGKGDGKLEQKIKDTEKNALPEDLPKNGEHIRQTIKHDKLPLQIMIDANVRIDDGKLMPAVKVTPHKFAQEEITKMTDFILGDKYFAEAHPENDNSIDIKADMNIKWWESMVAEAKINPPEEGNVDLAYLEEQLASARQDYLTAKPLSEFPEASRTLGRVDEYHEDSIFGCFEIDGRLFRLTVDNDESGKSSNMWLFQYGADQCDEYYWLKEQGEEVSGLAYDISLKIAEDTAKNIGVYDAGLRFAYAEGYEYPKKADDNSYRFIFTREINGVLCGYDSTDAQTELPYKHEEDIPDGFTAAQPWEYERLIVNVDKNGLQSFEWRAPYEVSDSVSDHTPLLTFEDTMACFSKMAFMKHSYLEDSLDSTQTTESGSETNANLGIDIRINRISLSLMRVRGGADYLLVPVWDFYGYKEYIDENGVREDQSLSAEEQRNARIQEQKQSFLTINAIDGSVIDRNYGY